jgi:hypothetical protein
MERTGIEVSADTQTERRIAWLTLTFGGVAAVAVAPLRGRLWGVGLAIGAVLA